MSVEVFVLLKAELRSGGTVRLTPCCDRHHLQPEKWGYSCVHCGQWVDIGRAPTPDEIELNCRPCESCKQAQDESQGKCGNMAREGAGNETETD